MFDVKTSMMQYSHQPHPLFSSKYANWDNKPTRVRPPAYDYSKLLTKQAPQLNANVGTPDILHPLLKTTQTGLWSKGVKHGTQSTFNSHPAPIAPKNGRRHTTGSLYTPTSSPVRKRQILPYFLEPVDDHPFCECIPTNGSGSTGGNLVKPTHPVRQVGPLKRSRSQSMAGNQLWNDLEQAESSHKSLRVDRIDPLSPYALSKKDDALRNLLVQQISKTYDETLEKNYVKENEADSAPKKEYSLHCLLESSPLKKEHLNTFKSETYPLFVSQQSPPLAKQEVTMTTARIPTTISNLTSTPVHLLNDEGVTQLASNEPCIELQRKQGQQMFYSQRKVGFIPENAQVRIRNNPTLYEEGKHAIQLTYHLPKINTTLGPMTSTESEGQPLPLPHSGMQPCSDYINNIRVLHQTFTEGPGSHPPPNSAPYLTSFPIEDGLHRADHKFVSPLQSHHDMIRQKLRHDIQCKRMLIRQQRSNYFKKRRSQSIPVVNYPFISPENIRTQSNDHSSNVADPYFIRNKQGDERTISMSALNRRPRITHNDNISSFKSRQNNSFSAGTNALIPKRGETFLGSSMINKYQKLKKGTNTGRKTGRKLVSRNSFLPCKPDAKHEMHSSYQQREKSEKDEQNLVGEESCNSKREKGPGEKEDTQHTRNPLSTMRQDIGPNGYVSQMSYGEFLKDIVVPMTLAVSNKDQKNQEKFASLVNFWQNQADQFQPDSPTGPSEKSDSSPFSARPSNVLKAENLGQLLLIERTKKLNTASRDDSIHEGETKGIVNETVGHENQTALAVRTIIGPSEKSNSDPFSNWPSNVTKAQDLRTLLLTERANRSKRTSRDDGKHEEQTKEFDKDVVVHENQTALAARTAIGPSKKSNSSPFSNWPLNVAKTKDLRTILLTERAIRSKRGSRDDSINEEETKEIDKDVVVHENQTALEARIMNEPNKKSNSTPISDKPSNVPKAENFIRVLLKEKENKTKRVNKDDSIYEEEAKEIVKDVVGHENQISLEARTINKWDEQITSTIGTTLTDNKATTTEKSLQIEETHPTERHDEESSSVSQIPPIKSVRVVLRTSDQIRMKFYNIGSSLHDQPKKSRRKQKHKRRKNIKKKKILLRIGSETLFTRSLYYSNTSPRKRVAQRKKSKVKEKTKTHSPPPKDFNRIALSVHKHEGETILHRAVRVNAKEVLLYCLGNNIGEINSKDNAGYTPLHECCVFDKVWMAEKLILHGADVNASALDGTRPIHDAVENHRADMTRLLLSHGADPLLPTYAKRTALDNATSFEIVTLLHEHLRDINGESDELQKLLTSSNINRRTLRFRSSIATQENEQRTDNFFDTSELIETAEEEQDAILYLKEIPQPRHIRLKLKDNEKVKTWYLLSDVLARLKIPAATFPYLYPHVKVNGLPTCIFLKKVERETALNQFDFAAICGERELVEFVEANDEMCSILQLEGWTADAVKRH